MPIDPSFILHQTDHWVLNHHLSSALPGYLMLGARAPIHSLADLPEPALAELGGLLARTQRIMEAQLKPKWLYISRFGHMPGFPLHFHFIPVYDWVEALFWQDERYRVLENFGSMENTQTATDGAELTLFIWREFGESPAPPVVQGQAVGQVIERLRREFERVEHSPGHEPL
jgi:diadenosine tetraphosphate (Ap4A) HIT family hydrolase